LSKKANYDESMDDEERSDSPKSQHDGDTLFIGALTINQRHQRVQKFFLKKR